MALSIYTNVASMNAVRHLSATQDNLSGNLARLSSGLRINQAADDAAGLAISEKLRSYIRSLGQAERNSNDGVSMLQTAEGAMGELAGIMTRMRELAVQSANGTLGSSERSFLNSEFSSLRSEVDRIAGVTDFNGIKLLDGTGGTTTFQVGIGATSNDTISVAIADLRSTALGSTSFISTQSVSTVAKATTALGVIDAAVTDISTERGKIGAAQNRLNVTISNLGSARESLSAANSRIRDVDVAEETAAMTRHNILMQAGVSVLAQANQIPSLALSLLRG